MSFSESGVEQEIAAMREQGMIWDTLEEAQAAKEDISAFTISSSTFVGNTASGTQSYGGAVASGDKNAFLPLGGIFLTNSDDPSQHFEFYIAETETPPASNMQTSVKSSAFSSNSAVYGGAIANRGFKRNAFYYGAMESLDVPTDNACPC